MWRWLRTRLYSSQEPSPAISGVVSTPRAQAYAELRAAELRRDDRDIGRARMALMQATHDELVERVWG